MPSNHLVLYCPLLFLPSIFPSIKVFANELAVALVAKYWSFSFSISPFNKYLGLISFKMGFACDSAGKESTFNVETWVQSLGWEDPPEKGWEDPPEKGKAIHSSILAWRISWTV